MSARSIQIENEDSTPKLSGTARPIQVEEKDISRFRSLVSAPLKGLLKELPDIAKMHDPVLAALSMFLPKTSQEKFYQEQVEEKLPTQPEFVEKSLERFGKMIPYAAIGGWPGIARAVIGASAGQAVEEVGGGPIPQAVAEIIPAGLPSLGRKIVPSSTQQRQILDLGRKAGLTEKQLAPMMPEDLKRRFFGKTASVGEKAKEKLSEMRRGGSQVYQFVKGDVTAKNFLSPNELQRFSSDMNKLGQDMPYAIRTQLKNDALDLVTSARQKGGVSGEDLINFYKDVSSRYNLGRTQLELFKGPIKKAIHSIDQNLGKNFDIANEIWKRQAKISKTLTPGEYEGLIDLGKTFATGVAAATGDTTTLIKILGYTGYRKLSTAMLTSPRLQNLTKQAQNALEKNNIQALEKIGNLIAEEIGEEKED